MLYGIHRGQEKETGKKYKEKEIGYKLSSFSFPLFSPAFPPLFPFFSSIFQRIYFSDWSFFPEMEDFYRYIRLKGKNGAVFARFILRAAGKKPRPNIQQTRPPQKRLSN